MTEAPRFLGVVEGGTERHFQFAAFGWPEYNTDLDRVARLGSKRDAPDVEALYCDCPLYCSSPVFPSARL